MSLKLDIMLEEAELIEKERNRKIDKLRLKLYNYMVKHCKKLKEGDKIYVGEHEKTSGRYYGGDYITTRWSTYKYYLTSEGILMEERHKNMDDYCKESKWNSTKLVDKLDKCLTQLMISHGHMEEVINRLRKYENKKKK